MLHCLQRLAGHPLLAEQVLNAPGALGRLWACLGCGADHIVAEGARLLVRLFAPAPARHGAPPWRLLRGEATFAVLGCAVLGCAGLGCADQPSIDNIALAIICFTQYTLLCRGLLLAADMLSNCCKLDPEACYSATHGKHPYAGHICAATAASPLGSEEVYLTNTREDNSLAKTSKMLAFPPSSQADRLAVLLKPLAAQPPMSHLTSMALLEAVAAVAVGEYICSCKALVHLLLLMSRVNLKARPWQAAKVSALCLTTR